MWGMVQRGDRASLALELRARLAVVGEGARRDLQGDGTTQAGIVSFVNFTHPTRAGELDDLVGTQPRSWRKGHDDRTAGASLADVARPPGGQEVSVEIDRRRLRPRYAVAR